jgi:ferritin-like metal-binding protein YciE
MKGAEPMPDKGTLNQRDAKLVQWLNEAYAKEAELESALEAHIALTEKLSYKKRLRKHLTETRDHKRRVASRIKQLGGSPSSSTIAAIPTAVGEVAGKALSAVRGQVGAARAAVTSPAETHVRNVQEELREEYVEIAIYTRIDAFATEVGDRETAQLARSIRREEERMTKFLDAELTRLVKDVVRAEVPRDQRATAKATVKRSSSSRARSTTTGGRTRSVARRRTAAGHTRARAGARS